MIKFEQSFSKLKKYCEEENFKGWDPYDGLNSSLFQSIPIVKDNRICRLIWVQLFKRNPINLRRFVGIKKEYNPKGLGLFLLGYCNLYKTSKKKEYLKRIHFLSKKIITLQAKGYSGACWGYNFDWQARAFFQPKNMPTVVVTSFIADALFKAFTVTGEKEYLDIAISSSKFVLYDLQRTYDKDGNFSFSYSPIDSTIVYNASLLGSRLLAQVYSYTKEKSLYIEAQKSVAFVCKAQRKNGSWTYGTLNYHNWIDSFHTGYNLECLHEYQEYTKDKSYQSNIDKGLEYYLQHFFTKEGIAKYYDNKTYPIDIHSVTQLLITFSKLNKFEKNIELIEKALKWTIDYMQSPKGFFYYQFRKGVNSKIPYMRWAQAWMFYCLSIYFKEVKK